MQPWIQTRNNNEVWITKPDPDVVDIDDIAHSLANQSRFTGHTRRYYSIAEHCCHCFDKSSLSSRVYALLHDSSEAYLNDIAKPWKHLVKVDGRSYEELERLWTNAILDALNFGAEYVQPSIQQEVSQIDFAMLHTEAQNLLPAHDWIKPEKSYHALRLDCWSPDEAKTQFLNRWKKIENYELGYG